jgi:hypothetical protein
MCFVFFHSLLRGSEARAAGRLCAPWCDFGLRGTMNRKAQRKSTKVLEWARLKNVPQALTVPFTYHSGA